MSSTAVLLLALLSTPALQEEEPVYARVRAEQELTLHSEVQGIVVERTATRGSLVKKNDVLLRLDPTAFRLQVERCQALVELADAQLDWATSTLKRAEGLFKEGSADQSALDEAQAMARIRRAELAVAQTHLKDAERNLDRTEIRSPIDGYLSELHPELGTYVTIQTLVAEVQSTGALLAEAFLTSAERVRVESHRELLLRWDGGEVRGVVRECADAAGRRQTFRLILQLPDHQPKLKAGMKGLILI
ncbi:MAG TPA: efflux RND transporter periplasmic adaptor subunit, partial [Planctomycetota bacterium]|nr:efflux RND transporter periplasmic adaptor subunit [Planctomycetota bacterium]